MWWTTLPSVRLGSCDDAHPVLYTLRMVAFFKEPTLGKWRFTRTLQFIYICYKEYKYLTEFVGVKSSPPTKSGLQVSFHIQKYFARLQCERYQCFHNPPDRSLVFLKKTSALNYFFLCNLPEVTVFPGPSCDCDIRIPNVNYKNIQIY